MVSVAEEIILLDLGAGTIRRLLETGTDIYGVSKIFFSHFHPDHTGELASFLFSNKYPDISRRRRPLSLLGGPGFSRFTGALKNLYGHWLDLGGDRLKIIELPAAHRKTTDFDGFVVTTSPVAHNPESLAYRIDSADNTALVYSGDTDYSENLIDLARGADLLICECAMPDEQKIPGHLTPSEAGDIAARAGVGRLVLTHLYPETGSVDLAGQCRRTYGGPLSVASDLMRFDLAGGSSGAGKKT